VNGRSAIGLGIISIAVSLSNPATAQNPTLPEIPPETMEEVPADPLMQQVPNVDSLSDLTPDHWAYKYVKSLNERYNILTGYPDNTFRGNQPFTREEFLAVLAKIFERVELFKQERQEDLDALRRLAEFYRSALKELRIRMDGLEERVATLDRQNFSPTTKLGVQVTQTLTNGTIAKMTAMSRLRLNLKSSFTGQDQLLTQLEFGTNGSDAIALAQSQQGNRFGTTGFLADGGGLQEVGTPSQGRLRKLYYQFPLNAVTITVGTALPPSDFVDRNRFANDSGTNFASSFFANNPLIVQNEIDRFGGAGVAVNWQISEQAAIRGLYSAADANRSQDGLGIGPCTAPTGAVCAPLIVPQPEGGLFGDRYQGTIEAELRPAKNFTTKLQYTNAKVNGTDINAFGVNLEWGVARELALFGRYGVGSYEGFNQRSLQNLDLNPRSWMVGATLRNFLITGSKAGIAIGQPFVESGLGNATQTNTEAYFSFLLNDKINVIPSIQIVSNPDNQKGRTIWQWAFRMVIDF
jgi:hypothetical protein